MHSISKIALNNSPACALPITKNNQGQGAAEAAEQVKQT